MSDSEKPKSSQWELIKNFYVSIDRKCKPALEWLDKCTILDICSHIARTSAFVSIIVGVIFYVMGCPERRMQAENQRKAKHYQAWQVINAAQGKSVGGGRKDALEDLNKDKVSLVGVDISKAYLPELNLENSYIKGANLAGANLEKANFAGANLNEANLTRANLVGASLAGAFLFRAILTGADLSHANLVNTKGWQEIKSIEHANIYDVKNPPDGFIEWANENGAVSIESRAEWEKLKNEKRQTIKEDK